MGTIGNQCVWENPEYFIGHTGFAGDIGTVMAGGTMTNYNLHYQLDSGSGFGGWHNLSYCRTASSGVSGAYTFVVTDATGIEVGDYIFGTGRVNPGKVLSISTNTITSDVANSATVSGVLRFNHLPSETISPSTGFKLRTRITTLATNTTPITFIVIQTTTTAAAQSENLYPLDTISLTVTGLVAGSDVVIYAAGTTTILDSVDAFAGTSWSYIYETPQPIDIGVIFPGYVLYYTRNYTLGLTDASVPVSQTPDRNYKP